MMYTIILDKNWVFSPSEEVRKRMYNPDCTNVDLPHDFSIIQKRGAKVPGGPDTGYFYGGVADYSKKIHIPEEWKDKKVLLEFEGVFMNCSVNLNGNLVTRHPYGYTTFHSDITPYINYGVQNALTVNINNNNLPNSRWYSGSGIYRHVWMLVLNKLHIAPWGIFATTPEAGKDSSTVLIKTNIINDFSNTENIWLLSKLIDKDGNEVCVNKKNIDISSNSSIEVAQTLNVSSPHLWSIDDPYLYTLESTVIKGESIIDSRNTNIGIRLISFDCEKGFQLNGNTMKLKGGCVHHDCGLLGTASFDRAEERKVELLKESGYNAVRCAHNPPAPAFLDACDRLGMLVIDEAFDCWRMSKRLNDYNLYFESWWEKDLASMILRDRNHPSIIMWSTGNEIEERNGRSQGALYSKKLADFVRNLDSTRGITNSLNNIGKQISEGLVSNVSDASGNGSGDKDEYDYFGELSYQFIKPLDVAGYNYLVNRYEKDGYKFPNRIICGTESFPQEMFDYWDAVEKLPYVIGDFVWTGLDYLGEAGIGHVCYEESKNSFLRKYPWNQANCGDIDICGFKRPQSYYRDCIWEISNKPYISVFKPENYGKTPVISRWGYPDVVSSWNWPGWEEKPVVVDVYSRDDEVELFLNDKSLGRKPAGKENRYTASFETVYVPGVLTVVGYKDGRETSRAVLKTAGRPAAIKLTPDRGRINAKFGDLSFVTVELVDSDGNVVRNAFNKVFFTVCGKGTLQAVGNSNPASDEMYVGNERNLHYGRAMAVVKSNGEKGNITLNASIDGIISSSLTISAE